MASEEPVFADVTIGQSVYDDEGNEIGSVRGVDDDGFYVRSPDSGEALSLTQARDVFGTAYVMWRCWECGEMGEIGDQLPANCPNCDAPREELYYWAED